MNITGQPIQNGICNGVVVDEGMPNRDRHLASDNCRAVAHAVVEYLKQVLLAARFQTIDAEVTKDQKLCFRVHAAQRA